MGRSTSWELVVRNVECAVNRRCHYELKARWCMQALDCCVEIPQGGVVRSLNVHVSGAIAVYEYTRRHGFS